MCLLGFEGVMIAVACLALNVFHPSVCMRELMEGAAGGIRGGNGHMGMPIIDHGKSEAPSVADTATT
ncbi:hypothetical protein B0T17DRAFT_523338 [Bombardia bombarda]|uniref:Uncharacterized protein n=1 Tax=Bombardia bombarda TaxID=252184 RepID=A0AA39X821_9PEZI|nr:hypothetical protein B0T17DRAFT_523338 [Bombardia bombarda]